MDAIDLRDFIVGLLIISDGGPAERWRPVVGDVEVIGIGRHTNWRVRPQGSADELFSVHVAVQLARENVPFVDVPSKASA